MNDIDQKIKDFNKDNEVVLYMKGNPTFPQCGFSSTVVQILKHLGVNFHSHDVLQLQLHPQLVTSGNSTGWSEG